MARKNIIEYLIDKGQLDRIAINKTAYNRIIEAEKLVKETIQKNRKKRNQKKFREKNRERLRLRSQKYYQENKKIVNEKRKKDRKENPEKYANWKQKYYSKNKEKIRKDSLERWERDKEYNLARAYIYKARTLRALVWRRCFICLLLEAIRS